MKKQLLSNCLAGLAFLMLAAAGAFAQGAVKTEEKITGGIVTLYALDPLANSLCFGDGREGGIIQQNAMFNRCSHINFNTYNRENLTVGIQGGEDGTITDLGSADELQKRYGYTETVGKGQGFASLRAADGKIFILKYRDQQARQPSTEQELTESASVFAVSNGSNETAPVKLGHIYIARITDSSNKTTSHLVKLIVIAYAPGESVTLRWQKM